MGMSVSSETAKAASSADQPRGDLPEDFIRSLSWLNNAALKLKDPYYLPPMEMYTADGDRIYLRGNSWQVLNKINQDYHKLNRMKRRLYAIRANTKQEAMLLEEQRQRINVLRRSRHALLQAIASDHTSLLKSASEDGGMERRKISLRRLQLLMPKSSLFQVKTIAPKRRDSIADLRQERCCHPNRIRRMYRHLLPCDLEYEL